jgi:putative transposase
VRTTDSQHDSPIFPDLYHNAVPDRPDRVSVADLTYTRVSTGFCFLAAILDPSSRKVVGYALSQCLDMRLALTALRAAVANRAPPTGCIHHTGRGC